MCVCIYIYVCVCVCVSEKAMATHSSTLAWKIPWTEEPGRLRSTGSLSQTGLSDFTFTFHFHALEQEMATHSSVLAWRIPGTGSLVGCCLWGHTESDTTEATQQQLLLDCTPHPRPADGLRLASPTSAHRDPATSSSCSVKSTCNSKNEIKENPGGTWSRNEDF